MIYWRIQDLYDANMCEQGRVDCEAYMAKTGRTPGDWLTAVEGLFGGVAGSVWGLGFCKPSSRPAATAALWAFIMATVERYSTDHHKFHRKLLALSRGQRMNLDAIHALLRAESTDENASVYLRAVSRMYYKAMQDTPLNVRAVEVSEQAMLAATHRGGRTVPEVDAYKAEYLLQLEQLRTILTGEE